MREIKSKWEGVIFLRMVIGQQYRESKILGIHITQYTLPEVQDSVWPRTDKFCQSIFCTTGDPTSRYCCTAEQRWLGLNLPLPKRGKPSLNLCQIKTTVVETPNNYVRSDFSSVLRFSFSNGSQIFVSVFRYLSRFSQMGCLDLRFVKKK